MRRSTLLLAGTALLLLPELARAWLPPADYLVTRVADKRRSMHGLSAKGIRTFLGKGIEGGKVDIAVEIWATSDGLYREEQHAPKSEQVIVSDGKKRVVVNDGNVGPPADDPRSLEQLLLTGASKEDYDRALHDFQVRPDLVTLGRLENKVCWVLGGKPTDNAPELWIDKERNLPLQLLDPRSHRKVVFTGWGEGPGGGMLPSRVLWYHGNDLEQELKIDEAKVNPRLPESLFKPDAPLPTPTPTPSPRRSRGG